MYLNVSDFCYISQSLFQLLKTMLLNVLLIFMVYKNFLALFRNVEFSLRTGPRRIEIHHCVHVRSHTHTDTLLGDSHACPSTPSWNLPTMFCVGTRPAMRNARCAIHYGFLEGAFHPPGDSFKGCTPRVYAC